jgi:gliding motility-associated peptidyl-prolyl isomerase
MFFLLIRCSEPQARKPINTPKNSFMKGSVARNKNIIKQQQNQFKKIIAQDSTLKYTASSTGFWYAHLVSSENKVLPKRGDQVSFDYKIEALDGTVLYDEMELGTVHYLVDKEELLPALREAVKVLSVNEIATFLFPSYLCYGYQGDDEKVDINQPLRFTIKLTSHSIKN